MKRPSAMSPAAPALTGSDVNRSCHLHSPHLPNLQGQRGMKGNGAVKQEVPVQRSISL